MINPSQETDEALAGIAGGNGLIDNVIVFRAC